MQIKISGDAPFQIPVDKFSVECADSGYTLYYSITGPIMEESSGYGYGYGYGPTDVAVWQESEQEPNEKITIYDAGVKGMWFKLVDNTSDAIISY